MRGARLVEVSPLCQDHPHLLFDLNLQEVPMSALTDTATTLAGAQLMKRAKWTWLGYGVAAYVGLRLMRKFGIFDKQADQAIQFIDQKVRGKAALAEASALH
jgi:hypothetical protein